MKTHRHLLSLLLLIGACTNSFSQDSALLEAIPKGKKEFLKSEKNVLATINWLENTQINDDAEKTCKQLNLLTAWMVTAPKVKLTTVNKNIVTFRGTLVTMFMAGYTKYVLENNHSKDELQRNLAGIRTAMKFYKNGNDLRIDGEMDELIELEEKGELEKWVKDQLTKK
jgi:hypothetical protein